MSTPPNILAVTMLAGRLKSSQKVTTNVLLNVPFSSSGCPQLRQSDKDSIKGGFLVAGRLYVELYTVACTHSTNHLYSHAGTSVLLCTCFMHLPSFDDSGTLFNPVTKTANAHICGLVH